MSYMHVYLCWVFFRLFHSVSHPIPFHSQWRYIGMITMLQPQPADWMNHSAICVYAMHVYHQQSYIMYSNITSVLHSLGLIHYIMHRRQNPEGNSWLQDSWGPSGAARTQVGPMLATWRLLSGKFYTPFLGPHDILDLLLQPPPLHTCFQ